MVESPAVASLALCLCNAGTFKARRLHGSAFYWNCQNSRWSLEHFQLSQVQEKSIVGGPRDLIS